MRRRWTLVVVLACFGLVVGTGAASAGTSAAAGASASLAGSSKPYPYTAEFAGDKVNQCLRRLHSAVDVFPYVGHQDKKLQPKTVVAGATFDLRAASWPERPSFQYVVDFKDDPALEHVCAMGGRIDGDVALHIAHTIVYHKASKGGLGYSGPGEMVKGLSPIDADNWVVLDGMRVDDVADPYRLMNNGYILANADSNWGRDDCIEDDNIAAGVIYDSLIQNCFMGVSERPGKGSDSAVKAVLKGSKQGELVIADSLLGLGMQEFTTTLSGGKPVKGSIVDGKGVAALFKWSGKANQLVLENDVLLVPWLSVNGKKPMKIPPGTIAHNVTLVWLGQGAYPGALVPGVTVTTNVAVWDDAVAAWYHKHGCTPDGRHCTRIIDPRPINDPRP